jgi:hypothetical protein
MAFDDERQALIYGCDSNGSESNGWNGRVRDAIAVGTVTRVSNTQVTIVTGPIPNFEILADEVVTVEIPGSILTGGVAITASPTFTINAGIRRSPGAMVLVP